MIDLHLHLDGSLDAEFLMKLIGQQGVDNISEDIVKSKITATKDCTDLNRYLQCFDLPLSLLQTEDALMQATYYLVEKLSQEGLLYAEIRFAPQLHTKKGLSIKQVIEAVLLALNEANQTFRIKAQIILCCMRGGIENKLANIETIEVGSLYKNKGVVAIDLAGAEALYKTKDFGYLFEICKGLDMPFVIHAGEADGEDSVRSAIEFGAKRIGHGIALQHNEELMRMVKERGIAIEMCPSSNLQTKAIKSIAEFPLRKYMDRGIAVTINTDNMVVSGTTIDNEFDLLKSELGLTFEEKKILLCNAVKASFLTEQDKTKLMLGVLKLAKE